MDALTAMTPTASGAKSRGRAGQIMSGAAILMAVLAQLPGAAADSPYRAVL